MCWVNDTAIPQVATEDIPIFKCCHRHGDTIGSYYFNYCYTLNEVYNDDINLEKVSRYNFIDLKSTDDYYYRIFKGFHSYHPDCSINDLSSEVILITYNGYLCDLLAKYPNYPIVKVEGYIPKGATYYLNTHGEYVSSSIVLMNVVEKFLTE